MPEYPEHRKQEQIVNTVLEEGAWSSSGAHSSPEQLRSVPTVAPIAIVMTSEVPASRLRVLRKGQRKAAGRGRESVK